MENNLHTNTQCEQFKAAVIESIVNQADYIVDEKAIAADEAITDNVAGEREGFAQSHLHDANTLVPELSNDRAILAAVKNATSGGAPVNLVQERTGTLLNDMVANEDFGRFR